MQGISLFYKTVSTTYHHGDASDIANALTVYHVLALAMSEASL
jgi:hypothetical protein